MANEAVFERSSHNPIVTPEMLGGDVKAIHNSGITRFGDGYIGIFRIDDMGLREGLYKGKSADGIHWDIDKERIQATSVYPEVDDVIRLGFDPRITKIEDVYYITYCYWYHNHKYSMPSILKTRDFESFEHVGFPLVPQNRNAVLFPRKIDGQYMMLHRPSGADDTDIFISTSPDLIHWGNHRVVMEKGGGWGWLKIGPGPTPIEVDEGWLMLYHAVRGTFTGTIYCCGGAILDRDEPWKVLHRGVRYLLHPKEDYERIGDVFNVVFPTSVVTHDDGDSIDLYYGCADTRIGMAHGSIRKIVDYIIEHRAETPDF